MKRLYYVLSLLVIAIHIQASGADSLSDRLVRAVEGSQLWKVRRLLRQGASARMRTAAGQTPLLAVAVLNKHKLIARDLLEAGALSEDADIHGLNSLHTAVLVRSKKLTQLCLSPQALDAQDDDGNTPLLLAIRSDDTELAQMLLDAGANMQLYDEEGHSPLVIAAQRGAVRLMHTLFDHGYVCSEQEASHVLYEAVSFNDLELTQKLLARGASVVYTSQDNVSVLHRAVTCSANIVRLLLDRGASVDAVTRIGQTPLHLACAVNNYEVVSLLLESSAHPDARTDDGSRPLMLTDSPLIIDLLLAHGATIDARNEAGETALMHVKNPALFALLRAGATVDIRDGRGWTALMHAVDRCDKDAVETLLSRGAAIDVRSYQTHESPLHLVARSRGDIARDLMEAGADHRAFDASGDIAGRQFGQMATYVVELANRQLDLIESTNQLGRPVIIEAGIRPSLVAPKADVAMSAWLTLDSYRGLLNSFHQQEFFQEGAQFVNPYTRKPLHRSPYAIDNLYDHLINLFNVKRLSLDHLQNRFLADPISLESFLVTKHEARAFVRDWFPSSSMASKRNRSRVLACAAHKETEDLFDLSALVEAAREIQESAS